MKYIQYVIIPRKPKMSTGKIASQTAHATYMALENQKWKNQGYKPKKNAEIIIENWEKEGMCVIVLECKTQIELMNIAKYLEQWKIPHHLYVDEGHTEIPMGTATALATGVLNEDKHWIFEKLKLFGK